VNDLMEHLAHKLSEGETHEVMTAVNLLKPEYKYYWGQ